MQSRVPPSRSCLQHVRLSNPKLRQARPADLCPDAAAAAQDANPITRMGGHFRSGVKRPPRKGAIPTEANPTAARRRTRSPGD